jgi:hypothetical protein
MTPGFLHLWKANRHLVTITPMKGGSTPLMVVNPLLIAAGKTKGGSTTPPIKVERSPSSLAGN